MKKLLVLVVLCSLCGVLVAGNDERVTKGEILALVHSLITGQDATSMQANGMALHSAANSALEKRARISLFADGESFCNENYLALLLALIIGGDRANEAIQELNISEIRYELQRPGDPELLPIESTKGPVTALVGNRLMKRGPGPLVFGFNQWRIYAPGELQVGSYLLKTVAKFGDDPELFEIVTSFFIDDASGPACN